MRRYLLFIICVLSSALYAEAFDYARVDSLINSAVYPVDSVNGVGDSVFMDRTRCIPGAVLCVVDSGRITYLRAYGNRAVVPTCEPMTKNTVFDLASLSKPLGAGSAALLLIELGRLSADDKVSTYLPAFQSDATIRDLLTHRSGLPPYMNARVLDSIYTARNIAQLSRQNFLLDAICRCQRLSLPGGKYRYSCLNFITLQRVVETIVGTDINTFLAANLYTPLHTDAMGWLPSDTLRPRSAPTECNDTICLRGIVHDPLARVMMCGISGNAGLFATAEDVAKWAIWFMSLPDSVRTVACNAGLWANMENGTLSHTGYTGTSIVLYPDCGRAIILLTNRVHPTDTGSLASLRRALTALLCPWDAVRTSLSSAMGTPPTMLPQPRTPFLSRLRHLHKRATSAMVST